MPNIKVSDRLGVDLINAPAGPLSGFTKYFKGDTAAFIASAELGAALARPVGSLGSDPLGMGMSFAADGGFGTSGVNWKFSAGANVLVRATQSGSALPGDNVFGHPITVREGQTIVDVTFTPTLAAGMSTGAAGLQFGFSAGGSVAFRTGRAFDLTGGNGPALSTAIASLLSSSAVPADVEDLKAMAAQDIASVSGSGNLKLSASFDVAQVVNPAASPSLPVPNVGKVAVKAGLSLQVGASVEVKGSYQVRVQKLAGSKVRLGYFKMASSQMEFNVTASAGISVTAWKTEVLQRLLGMLGDPEADGATLEEAGLNDAQIATLKDVVEKSLSRSIAVSLAGTFAARDTRTRMFEYEIELDRLETDGVAAVNGALQGDLSALTSRASTALPQGVRMVVSELDEVKSRNVAWKINLLGVVNVLTVRELVRSGNTLFNAETGELVVTDSATAKKLRVETRPLEADGRKLHKVLMQSLILTAAYRASESQPVAGSLSGSMSYFEQTSNARRQTISDYLDNLTGTGLATEEEKTAFLVNTFSGRASVFLEASFGDSDMRAMFFDAAGKRRAAGFYEEIGRAAIGALIQPGDENDFRRLPMRTNDAGSNGLWKRMSAAGPASLHTVLAAPLNGGPQLAILRHDYVVVKWWTESMTKAAKAVEEMKAFIDLTGLKAEELKDDEEFNKRRRRLKDALADVASDALPDFLDAWGVLVMDACSGRKAALSGILVTAGSILVRKR